MKRYLKRTLLAFLPILALSIAALTLDFGFLRGPIERVVSNELGRSFTIDGELSIHLGQTTTIEAHDLALGQPAWLDDGHLLRVRRVYLELQTASLWQKAPVTISSLIAEGALVSLVEDSEGRTSWTFDESSPTPSEPRGVLPLLLLDADVRDVQLELISPALEKTLQVHIRQFEQSLDATGDARLTLAGTVDDEEINLQGKIGPWERLGSGRDIALSAKGKLGLGSIELESRFDDLFAPVQPEIHLRVQSPSFAHMTETLGLGDWGEGDVNIEINSGSDQGLWSVEASADVGQLKLDLSAKMPGLGAHETLSLRTRAQGPNLGRIVNFAGYSGWPEAPFSLAIDLQRGDAGLNVEQFDLNLADTRFEFEGHVPRFPSIVGADVVMDLEGDDLALFSDAAGVGPLPPGPFSIDGLVRAAAKQRTELDLSFDITPAKGRLQGFLVDDHNFELALVASGADLAELKRLQGLGTLPSGPFQVDGSLTGEAAGTGFDFNFSIPPGEGQVTGYLRRNDWLSLDLDTRGALASRLGHLFGIDGLPETPWTLSLDLEQPSDATYDLRRLVFATSGTQLGLKGALGAQSLLEGTDLDLSLSGDDVSTLQQLLPETVTLPQAPFSVSGHITGGDDAWLLKDLVAEIGPSRIHLDGQLGSGDRLAGTDLAIRLNGRELGALVKPPVAARLPDGPFESLARLQIAEDEIVIEGFELDAGALSLRADLRAPWPLGFGHGEFRLQGKGPDITTVLPELAGLELEALRFDVSGQGRWSEEQVQFDDLNASLGDARFQLSGKLDLPPDASATDMTLRISVPDLSRIATLRGSRYGSLPLELDTHLAGDETHMELTRLSAQIGESTIKGLFRVDLQGEKPDFELRVSTDLLNLRPVLEGKSGGADQSQAGNKKDRVIPDTPIPFERLGLANGSFAIAADKLILRRTTLYDSVISGRLVNGELHINEMGMDMTGGRLNIGLDIVPSDRLGARVTANIHSRNLIFDFTDAPREQKLQKPPINIDADFQASGASLRQLATSLEGDFVVSSAGGRIVRAPSQDEGRQLLVEIVEAVAPSSALKKEIKISCLALVGAASQGVVELKPGLALQTDRINTFSSGTIDLAEEKINLNINSRTRRLVDISAGDLVSPYVKVTGTLAKPSIGIDAKGTLLTGGAAILSGGLSLLAQKAIGSFTGENPCAEFLEEAAKNEVRK